MDNDGDLIGRIYVVRTAGGSEQVGIYAYNGDASNGNVNTGFRLGIDRSSNATVGFTHPAAWRAGLNLGEIVTKDISSNVSCAASTYTALGSITLGAGTWVISAGINYASGAVGMRYACISTNSGTTAPSAEEQRSCAEYVYLGTANPCRLNVTRIVSITASTTYYLKGWQNGVSAGLNATGYIRATRVG